MNTTTLTTIVTGFVDIGKYGTAPRKPRNIYHEAAKHSVLTLPLPLYVCVEEDDYDFVVNVRQSLNLMHLTKVVVIDYTKFVLYPYLENLHKTFEENFIQYIPEYVPVINEKSEFLKVSIRDNYWRSKYFMWIDYGIMTRAFNKDSFNKIKEIASKPHSKFSFGLLTYGKKKYTTPRYEYKDLMMGWKWVSACGILTLPSNSDSIMILQKWQDIAVKACTSGLFPFEESIMFYLYNQNPELFDVFYTSEYETIFEHYTRLHL